MLIFLHGLIYIILMMQWAWSWFQTEMYHPDFSGFLGKIFKDYCSQFCSAVSLIELDFLTFRTLQLAQNMSRFPVAIQNTTSNVECLPFVDKALPSCQFPHSPYSCSLKLRWSNAPSIRLFQNLLDLSILDFWSIR